MDTNYLTAVDIAKVLKISKALAYRLIAQKRIQSVRFGKTVRVSTEELEAFISRNTQGDSNWEMSNNSSAKTTIKHL